MESACRPVQERWTIQPRRIQPGFRFANQRLANIPAKEEAQSKMNQAPPRLFRFFHLAIGPGLIANTGIHGVKFAVIAARFQIGLPPTQHPGWRPKWVITMA